MTSVSCKRADPCHSHEWWLGPRGGIQRVSRSGTCYRVPEKDDTPLSCIRAKMRLRSRKSQKAQSKKAQEEKARGKKGEQKTEAEETRKADAKRAEKNEIERNMEVTREEAKK